MNTDKVLKPLNDRNHFLKHYLKDNLPKAFYRTAFNRKIRNANYIHQYKLSEDYQKAIRAYWEPHEKISLIWHKAFSAISGIEDVRYVPEDVFYKKIEPSLNRLDLALAYVDKNMSDKLFADFKKPKTIIRNMNGYYYNADYQNIDWEEALQLVEQYAQTHKMVLKPAIDSGAGKNIKILDYTEQEPTSIRKSIATLFRTYQKDFIVQDFLYQHPLFQQMHSDSLNTLRIISLRLEKEVFILSQVVRMGNGGSYTDNAETGCITCGFDEQGQLKSYATNHWTYERYEQHPYSHFVFKDKKLPSIEESRELVKKAHEELFYFDLVSWDIAIDCLGEPHLIEIGVHIQDVNYHQRTNGPLFGQLTDAVLKRVYRPAAIVDD